MGISILVKRHIYIETGPCLKMFEKLWVSCTVCNNGNNDPAVRALFASHDDVIKWKHFARYWPFLRGIRQSAVNSPHKGQWRGALLFSLICAWINGWINNREAGNLRCHRAHYDVTVMAPSVRRRIMNPRPSLRSGFDFIMGPRPSNNARASPVIIPGYVSQQWIRLWFGIKRETNRPMKQWWTGA